MDNMSGNMGCDGELLIKSFCHFLIQNSSGGYFHVDDIPDFCAEYIDILRRQSMTIYHFANCLNCREYDSEIMTSFEEKRAKELGFVVVFGYSDDCTEFRGAYEEEIGCFNGGRVFKCGEKYIDAVWCKGEFTWTYNTNIPHATFDIFDDEKYCKGIVFELKDMFNELDYQ